MINRFVMDGPTVTAKDKMETKRLMKQELIYIYISGRFVRGISGEADLYTSIIEQNNDWTISILIGQFIKNMTEQKLINDAFHPD